MDFESVVFEFYILKVENVLHTICFKIINDKT